MKKIYLFIKLWYCTKKFLKAKTANNTFYWLEKIKQTNQDIEKNKGSKIAAFIRQMKQR